MSEADNSINHFDWLANVYTSHSAINHPSELHGLLFGELSGGIRLTEDEWLTLVIDHMGIEELNTERQTNLNHDLVEFYQHTNDEVEKDSSAFTLLLPDDDYALSERVEALSLWTRGFLEGLAISAQGALNKISDDLQEILRDFVEISQLDDRVVDSEDGEREFFEICEYVRIGVLNLYAEFNQLPEAENDNKADQPTLH